MPKTYINNNNNTEKRIIIVDDDVDFTESLQELLIGKNYSVVCANDIFTAKKLLLEFNPQVALLDIRLGEGSGINLLKIFIEEFPNILCTMLTAYANTETAIECLRLGAYDYLRKPVQPDHLFAVLDRSFDKYLLLKDKSRAELALQESEEKYRTLVETAPYCIHQMDLDGHIISMNTTGLNMLGAKNEDEVLNRPILSFYSREDRDWITKLFSDAKNGKYSEFEYIGKNGYFYLSSFIPISDARGNITRLMGITQDITERKLSEAKLSETSNALKETERKFRDLVNNIPGAVYRCKLDKDWTKEYLSPTIEKISGYPAQDFIHNRVRTYTSIIHPDDVQLVEDIVMEGVKSRQPYVINYRIIHKNGEIRWVYEKGQALYDDNENVIWLDGAVFDNTESHELSEQLSYQASHDTLTGLVNRMEFEKRLNRILTTSRKDQSEHALLYLDLDQFKVVNDTCGHVAGDELLNQLGILLNCEVRKRDTIARLGGDEFGVLMEHCSINQAKRVAENLRKVIEGYRFLWEDKYFNIGVSIGLVIIDETIGDMIDILKKADSACYAAKEQGRNRIHLYHADDEQLSKQHGEMQWVSRINRALEEDRFAIAIQKIIPLNKNESKNKYYELLIRLNEDGEIITPGKFLSAAERYGIAHKIDRWMIQSAFDFFVNHQNILDTISKISINLSGHSLGDDNFLKFVIKSFENTKMPPGKICFEITETAAIANLSKANIFIDKLKEIGCMFALDDFGSGLSSFAYLKTLEVDFLKIDGFFVKDINDDPIDFAMVKSINEIGHEMGIKTIAEFVETEQILEKIQFLGVDYAQGYYFGKPEPIYEITGH